MPTRAPSPPSVIPFITLRAGETVDPLARLRALSGRYGPILGYADGELPTDRDVHGVLWARVRENAVLDGEREGAPRWLDMHPARQRHCMQLLRCQIGDCRATRPDGTRLFLFGGNAPAPDGRPFLVSKPPVCEQHAPVAAQLCPALTSDPYVVAARTARLYGVSGARYQHTPRGPQPVESDDRPIPYGTYPHQHWILATQMWRELRDYRVTKLADLKPAPATEAPHGRHQR
jgi:hypothetical protein